MDSIEPLVPTARVQVLDSNEPLVLPCVSSVLDEPVDDPSGMPGPSGVAASSSGSLRAIAISSEDDDEDIAPAMPSRTGSSGRRINPYSDELKSMWNWRKIFGKLGTHDQCIQFVEENGLILRQKMCSYYCLPMSLSKNLGKLASLDAEKATCAIVTWFENALYAFSEGQTYHQTRKELAYDDAQVVSLRTVAVWFSFCWETIATYELEDQSA